MVLSPREASELLRRHGLAPRRSLGQNFVVDQGTARRIARLAGVGPGDQVIEIGAGLGALTVALLETGADVKAVEIDHGLVRVLRETLPELDVIEADARDVDWRALLAGRRATVVANLPYNIATPLVADLLDAVPDITRLVVLVQREVAERFVARPRTKAYGAVTVKLAYWATAKIIGRVPPHVFLPRPNVDSALVEIVRRAAPAVDPSIPRERLFELVRAGFGQRRKTLRRSLAGLVEADDFAAAAVEPGARAEELDVATWGRLARAVEARVGQAGRP